MQNKRGFTLIELIIAISILSLLMFTGSYVYSTLSSRWDKELGEFNAHFSETRSIILLQEVLSGVMPFVVRDGQGEQLKPTMFFVGKEESLLAVSRSGIINQQFPEIFRLTAIQNENEKLDLMYQSTSTETIVLTNTNQSIDFDHSVILLRDLDAVSFNYLGWSSFSLKNQSTDEMAVPEVKWYADYSGVDRQLNPEKIELTMSKGNKVVQFEVWLDMESQRFLEHYLSDSADQ